VRQTDRTLFRAFLARFTFCRMSFALAVQMNGFGFSMMPVDVALDCHDQFLDISEDATPEPVLCELAKEPFHHVQPGCARRREVHVETGVPFQPALQFGIVVPGNPDLVDTWRVEPPPFLHTSFYVDGRSDSGAGLLSHACRSADGGARSSPLTQRFLAPGEATQADRCGPIALRVAGPAGGLPW
jgi:hypothetical protein